MWREEKKKAGPTPVQALHDEDFKWPFRLWLQHAQAVWARSSGLVQIQLSDPIALRKLLNRVLCDVSGAGESKRQPVSQVRGDMATE